jgi:hypothetical protein
MSAEQPLDRRDLLHDLQAGEAQCTARSKCTGKRCRAPSMLGGNVCRAHGGAAPQTRAKALRRLQQAADVLVQRLLGLALDGEAPDAVALQAIRDALDRAGLGAKQALELSAKPLAPWEEIMGDIALEVGRTTRAEHRARRGLPPSAPPALPTPEIEVVDAELVPEQEPHTYRPSCDGDDATHPGPTALPADKSAISTAPVTPPPRSLTQEEAAAVLRAARVRTAPMRRRRRPNR